MTNQEYGSLLRGEDVSIATLPTDPASAAPSTAPPTTTAPTTTTTTVPFVPTGSFAVLSGGHDQTCALTPQGGVKCWGSNGKGQLGNGSTVTSPLMVDVSGLTSGVAAISSGRDHTCALTDSGGVKCWGKTLGQSDMDEMDDPLYQTTPVDVPGLTSGVAHISSGEHHTCAVTDAGAVKCWGKNDGGQLGDDTTSNSFTPVDVVGLGSGIASVEVGDRHTCAVTTSGGVKCWGLNYGGQLGDDTDTSSSVPVDVLGLGAGVASVELGTLFSCAVTTAGGVKCWGYNQFGQIGDGTNTDRWTPTQVSGLTSGVSALSAGDLKICALMTSGGVKCWGNNSSGGLGDGTKDPRSVPVDVVGISTATSVGSGQYHACAVLAGGDAKCWGYNWGWQLGDGTQVERPVPVDVFPSV
ncbi:MAG: RCC1 domain-containing protein [Microthrixaceae bacterium]